MDESSEPNVEAVEPTRSAGVSRTTLVVSVVVAVIVAGLAGVAIGWKIEQQRVKDDLSNIRPIGRVTAVDDDSVTIKLKTADGSKTYAITDGTKVDGTGEMDEGSTILIRSWKHGDGGQLQATQISVLDPADGSADSSG